MLKGNFPLLAPQLLSKVWDKMNILGVRFSGGKGTGSGTGGPPVGASAVLMETGDYLLIETADHILLE